MMLKTPLSNNCRFSFILLVVLHTENTYYSPNVRKQRCSYLSFYIVIDIRQHQAPHQMSQQSIGPQTRYNTFWTLQHSFRHFLYGWTISCIQAHLLLLRGERIHPFHSRFMLLKGYGAKCILIKTNQKLVKKQKETAHLAVLKIPNR